MQINRFDDRRVIGAIIAQLAELGWDLDEVDVQLSLHGPVDLDLLQDCIRETAARQAAAQPPVARAA
ncbi:MAG: hypothetical protein M9939_13875 [Mesorhizobium sp.]|nr:hypothetical protein [Mesorhizobium sp.]MCO5162221.1 hypothetical protein [Mesorhizobium sp.]